MSVSRVQDTVFGYIRQKEIELTIAIPLMIQYLCMNYYWIKEMFKCNAYFITLEWGNKIAWGPTVKSLCPRWTTLYGNNVVDISDTSVTAYRWTLRLKNIKCICVGISSKASEQGVPNTYFESMWNEMTSALYIKDCSYHDIIIITLNIETKQLQYQHNKWVMVEENIDLKNQNQNLALSISNWRNKRIVLVDFETFGDCVLYKAY